MLSRRKFIKSSLGLAVSSLASNTVFSSLAESMGKSPDADVSPSLKRFIPSTGEEIPLVGLGSFRTFDVGEEQDKRAPIKEVLRLFYEAGGRMVDSSPQYAKSEKVIGELAAELNINEDLFMATKVWTEGKENGIQQMESSFKKLGVQTMDLMQVHNLIDWKTHLETLYDWKESGRIRYIGITHYLKKAYRDLEKVMKRSKIDFVQVNYSLLEPDADKRILPFARDNGIAVIINRPYALGGLFKKIKGKPLPDFAKEIQCETWAQVFLKWVLSHPAVTCAIPGTSKPKHLLDNMAAGTKYLPTAAERKVIQKIVKKL